MRTSYDSQRKGWATRQGPIVDEPLDSATAPGTRYYDADGLGSITSIGDISGSLTDTYTTDSFGKPTASTGTTRNPYRYTARDFDPETGLFYYRARYYDPQIGRFISEDPTGFEAGANFYDYVQNNPTDLSDPAGLVPTVLPPAVSPWTAAEEAAYQAFARGLQGTSKLLSGLGTGLLAASYLLDPSSSNNAQWAHSAEAQFEQNPPSSNKSKECGKYKDCEFAGGWRLKRILERSGAKDAHEFKEWYVGHGAKVSQYDICACKDGSVVIKARGQCGKPGPAFETGVNWK